MDFVFQGGSPHKGASAKPLATYVHAVQKPVDARLAQSAERKALNLVVVGSSPTVGVLSVDCWSKAVMSVMSAITYYYFNDHKVILEEHKPA